MPPERKGTCREKGRIVLIDACYAVHIDSALILWFFTENCGMAAKKPGGHRALPVVLSCNLQRDSCFEAASFLLHRGTPWDGLLAMRSGTTAFAAVLVTAKGHLPESHGFLRRTSCPFPPQTDLSSGLFPPPSVQLSGDEIPPDPCRAWKANGIISGAVPSPDRCFPSRAVRRRPARRRR